MDSFFPDTRFFTEFERFDRYVDRLTREGRPPDYVSICSPNYLHDAHVRFALRSGAEAICEKPLVLSPWNIDGLAEMEASTGRRINTILQLRLHPAIIALRDRIANDKSGRIHDVDLTYIASRGRWYYTSWKGDDAKSGGIAMNIGVHFYDMLSFVFGPLKRNVVHHRAMAAWVAHDVIKTMVKHKLRIDAARVLVMGFTFKENVPDTRNTKVADLVAELKDFVAEVVIYDPQARPEDARHEYGLEIVNALPGGSFDAVVLAVRHAEIQALGLERLKKLVKRGGVIYDLKGILKRGPGIVGI